MTLSVTALCIYPVKSLRGISLRECRLTTQGLEHDRRWMVVRENGRFVTQRDIAALALIETRLEPDGVVLSRKGFGSHKLLFNRPAGEKINSKVWNDPVETSDEGDQASTWITAATESNSVLRVVRMAEGFRRQHNAADRFGKENFTQFADASPYLVANESSLEALNEELRLRGHAAIPMNRFRPNIVIKGLDAFTERGIQTLSNSRYQLELRDPCERCVVPTIDQETGIKNPQHEPFRTLTEINPMPAKKSPAFAENATLSHGAGQLISIGDTLRPDAQIP